MMIGGAADLCTNNSANGGVTWLWVYRRRSKTSYCCEQNKTAWMVGYYLPQWSRIFSCPTPRFLSANLYNEACMLYC